MVPPLGAGRSPTDEFFREKIMRDTVYFIVPFLTDLIKVIIKILSEFTVISVTRLISFFLLFLIIFIIPLVVVPFLSFIHP